MKALSIRQPWAHLIATGVKDTEIRYWPRFSGVTVPERIAIHVSKSIDVQALGYLKARFPDRYLDMVPPVHDFYRGGVIATAELQTVKIYRDVQAFNNDQLCHLNPVLDADEFAALVGEGHCFGLVLRYVQPLDRADDCPCQLGFWEWMERWQ